MTQLGPNGQSGTGDSAQIGPTVSKMRLLLVRTRVTCRFGAFIPLECLCFLLRAGFVSALSWDIWLSSQFDQMAHFLSLVYN
jgi:hypothetical protein